MKKRRGNIRIGRYFLKEDLESVQLVFAKLIPIYINDNPWNNYVEYTGYSNLFEEIPEGFVGDFPTYDVVMENIDGVVSVKEFKKIN